MKTTAERAGNAASKEPAIIDEELHFGMLDGKR